MKEILLVKSIQYKNNYIKLIISLALLIIHYSFGNSFALQNPEKAFA
jgi:hypothetical protein